MSANVRRLSLTVASALIAYCTIFGALGAAVTVIVAFSGDPPTGTGLVIGLVIFAILALPAFLIARRFDRVLQANFLPPN